MVLTQWSSSVPVICLTNAAMIMTTSWTTCFCKFTIMLYVIRHQIRPFVWSNVNNSTFDDVCTISGLQIVFQHVPDVRTDFWNLWRFVSSGTDGFTSVHFLCFSYIISTLELLVVDDYMIIYLNGATPTSKTPGLRWLKRCQDTIERRY